MDGAECLWMTSIKGLQSPNRRIVQGNNRRVDYPCMAIPYDGEGWYPCSDSNRGTRFRKHAASTPHGPTKYRPAYGFGLLLRPLSIRVTHHPVLLVGK